MATRHFIFLIVPVMLFISTAVCGQQVKDVSLLHPISSSAMLSPKFSLLASSSYAPSMAGIIPSNLYVKNLAFFCRQEFKVEKTVRLPLRFRVGSLEQCNKLEGK